MLLHRLTLPILSMLLAMLAPLGAFAASSFSCNEGTVLSQADAEAKLKAVQKNYDGIPGLKAKFTQRSYALTLDEERSSVGKVSFSKPGKMRWEYEAPNVQTFLVLDTTVWFYQAAERQVIIDQFRRILISDLPVSFLLGLGNLGRDFKVQKACARESNLVFVLRPSSEEKGKAGDDEQLDQFTLLVKGSDLLPRGAQVKDLAGNTTSILLDEIKVTSDFQKDAFSPKFPKGTDVSDHRVAGDDSIGERDLPEAARR
jgi:outer membrane lipoprotein carrier protein